MGQQGVKKNEIRTVSYQTHTQTLKMDYKPKCKTGQYKTLRGSYSQNTLTEVVTISFWIYLLK